MFQQHRFQAVETDTLRLAGSGATLNLTLIPNTWHADLEAIDLTGTGNNGLTLALADVLAFSSNSDTVRVDGNAGDTVTATDPAGSWTAGADEVIGVNTYHSYTQASATLLIDTDISSNL